MEWITYSGKVSHFLLFCTRLPPDDRPRLKKHAKNEGKVVRMMPELMQKEPDL